MDLLTAGKSGTVSLHMCTVCFNMFTPTPPPPPAPAALSPPSLVRVRLARALARSLNWKHACVRFVSLARSLNWKHARVRTRRARARLVHGRDRSRGQGHSRERAHARERSNRR